MKRPLQLRQLLLKKLQPMLKQHVIRLRHLLPNVLPMQHLIQILVKLQRLEMINVLLMRLQRPKLLKKRKPPKIRLLLLRKPLKIRSLQIRKLLRKRSLLPLISVNLIKPLLLSALPIRPRQLMSAKHLLLITKSVLMTPLLLLKLRKLPMIRPLLKQRLQRLRKLVPNLRQIMQNALPIKLNLMTVKLLRLEMINVLRLSLMLLLLLKPQKPRLQPIRKLGLHLVLQLQLLLNYVLQKKILLPIVSLLGHITNSVLNMDGSIVLVSPSKVNKLAVNS